MPALAGLSGSQLQPDFSAAFPVAEQGDHKPPPVQVMLGSEPAELGGFKPRTACKAQGLELVL
jgi:hypothetical protein